MSSQTAEFFKDKNSEEIIDWMFKNLSTDQIRQCLGDEIPSVIEPEDQPKTELTVYDLRKFCANKKYIIHTIKDEIVYFWYFFIKSKKWVYVTLPLSDFPKVEGGQSKECGPDDLLSKDELKKMKPYWNSESLGSDDIYEKRVKPTDETKKQKELFDEIIKENYNFTDDSLEPIDDEEDVPTLEIVDDKMTVDKMTVEKLRNICSDKPYLIHMVENDNVYFWYLINKKWKYFKLKVTSFPNMIGGNGDECGPTDNIKKDLNPYWNKDSLDDESKFNQKKLDSVLTNQDDTFEEIMSLYELSEDGLKLSVKPKILEEETPKIPTEKLEQLQNAIDIQKSIKIEDNSLIQFVPILIRPSSKASIYVYYLDIEDDKVVIKGDKKGFKIEINQIKENFVKILENFQKNFKLITEEKPIEYWQIQIKQVVNNFFVDKQETLDKIKILYSTYPLSEEENGKFFMKNLFNSNNFGKIKSDNLNDLIKMSYGDKFVELFKYNISENNFGLKTLNYSLK